MLDQVREFVERLRAQEATSADGLRIGRQLVGSATGLDIARSGEGVAGNLTLAAAFGLLDGTLPPHHVEDRPVVAGVLWHVAHTLPRLVEHAAAHLSEDDEGEPEDDGAAEASETEDLEDVEERQFEPLWARVQVPTLLLRAGQAVLVDNDQLLPEESAAAIKSTIKDCRYVNFPTLNHYTIIFGVENGPVEEIHKFVDEGE